MKRNMVVFFVIIGLVFLANGCKENNELDFNDRVGVEEEIVTLQGGTFSFSIRPSGSNASLDKQGKPEDVLALVITIDQVEVHKLEGSDSGWYTIDIEASTLDVMEPGVIEQVIASSEIPAGEYNQLRFQIDSAQVTTESGEYEAEVPSGKLKINVPFTIFEDGATEVTITIDPRASLVVAGPPSNPKYLLRPVIHVTDIEEDQD
jgi:hypothetical protein